jgi:membrane protein
MRPVQFVTDEIRRLFEKPRAELTRAQSALIYSLDLTRHCARELYHDRATQMAAALTYHTLFSLLPTVVLMLVVMRAFVTQAELASFRDSAVSYVMQWLAESSAEAGAAAASSPRAEMIHFAGQLRDGIQYWLDRLQALSFEGIGLVGILLFIYGATGLLATIESSFNQIFGASQNRPWYLRLSMYYTVITLGPLIILAGRYLEQTYLRSTIDTVSTRWLIGPLGVASPILFTWLVLWTVFVLLPNTRVSVRAAGIGSLIAALGWVSAIELFGLYVRGAAVANLYGALALLPLFLFWLWLLWLFLLFGLELTYALQSMHGRKFKSLEFSDDRETADVALLLPMLTLIGRGFEKGKPVSSEEIAERLFLPIRSVRRLAECLEKARLVNRVDDAGSTSYSLAMPPDRIQVETVIELACSLSTPRRGGYPLPGSALLVKLAEAQKDAARHLTLASIVREQS